MFGTIVQDVGGGYFRTFSAKKMIRLGRTGAKWGYVFTDRGDPVTCQCGDRGNAKKHGVLGRPRLHWWKKCTKN